MLDLHSMPVYHPYSTLNKWAQKQKKTHNGYHVLTQNSESMASAHAHLI